MVGLFTAFAIPIYLRWRMGDKFVQGEWNLGKHWKWIAPLAVLEVAIVSIYFILPATPTAIPFRKGFSLVSFNYTPVAVIVILGGALIWWFAGAKNHFKGPVRTIDQ